MLIALLCSKSTRRIAYKTAENISKNEYLGIWQLISTSYLVSAAHCRAPKHTKTSVLRHCMLLAWSHSRGLMSYATVRQQVKCFTALTNSLALQHYGSFQNHLCISRNNSLYPRAVLNYQDTQDGARIGTTGLWLEKPTRRNATACPDATAQDRHQQSIPVACTAHPIWRQTRQ